MNTTMGFRNDNTAGLVAQQIRATAYQLAARLRSGPGGFAASRKADAQIAAGNVAAKVYLARATGNKKMAIEAMRMMNDYSQQMFRKEQAMMAGRAYSFSSAAIRDRGRASLDNLANKQFIQDMSTRPAGDVISALQGLFERFNQFLQTK